MRNRGSRILENAVRRDEASAAIVALRPDRRQVDISLARHFHDVKVHHHYVFEYCASIQEYGEKHGYSSHEAKTLARAGEALSLNSEIEGRVLEGRITLEGAAALARVFGNPALIKAGEDWLEMAETLGTRTLWRKIRERMIEVAGEGPPSQLNVVIGSKDRDDFERAREILSEKERRVLEAGPAIGLLSRFFLHAVDPDRKRCGKRRVGDTSNSDSRYIPVSERRKVRKRSGGVCQWPRCENRIFLNFAHWSWFAAGGSQEARNLLLLCQLHHALLDAGRIKVKGTADSPRFYEKVSGKNNRMNWRRVVGVRGPPDAPAAN